VLDYQDKCLGSTPEEQSKGINAQGCPVDTDADGVGDYADACPNNSPEEIEEGVNLLGCPVDQDKDGVPDSWDTCPNNTVEELIFGVGPDGCAQDTDNDGYPDYRDQCRQDPTEDLAQGTDEQGCPKDSDQDGVYDVYDICPDTAQNKRVNEQGCPLVTLFSDNSFESGSSTLSAEGKEKLRDFAQALVPEFIERIIITAHADSQGTAEFNLRLSQERADSVARFLRKQGLASLLLHAQGAGESLPIADNATEQGRSKNRRVELNVRLKAKDQP
jgi:outer membrane protein OmpA-like peptidoglycan-associated protein